MNSPVNSIAVPIAVGGVGGSGTRLVAEFLRSLQYYLGGDLNPAVDNLWFTLLFKRIELFESHDAQPQFERAIRIFLTAMTGNGMLIDSDEVWIRNLAKTDRPQHPAIWLGQRADSLLRSIQHRFIRTAHWGWKEPNTHIVLDRLVAAIPGLKYIHVLRNGLDMAYSTNQNQLRLWGRQFLKTDQYEINPFWSLKFWCIVHRRIFELARQFPGRILIINFDSLCSAPRDGLPTFCQFLGMASGASFEESLLGLVRQPESIGRFKLHGLAAFDPDDVCYVRSLGFDVSVHK